MSQSIQLSEIEKSRLERIVSLSDLHRQKRVAYPFWGLAAIFFLLSLAALFTDPLLCLLLMAMTIGPLMIGMARFGYYKLFRLLQHQNAIIEQLQHSPQNEG